MARWEPGAQDRLVQAAMELYAERGYEHTTVADIAERAGLTRRTFFRYFTDKREVLFGGSAEFEARMIGAVAAAPASASPLEAVVLGLEACGADLQGRREHSQQRFAIIAASAELQERELIKLTLLAASVTRTLRERGVADPAATLAAEAGMAVFRVAYERWAVDPVAPDLAGLVRASLDDLRAVTA